jgi:hypothetical protein
MYGGATVLTKRGLSALGISVPSAVSYNWYNFHNRRFNMAKLVYWYAECLDDADAYSVIAKTKKAALAELGNRNAERFGEVEKRTITYRDAFDLFDWCTSEGGGRGCGAAE